MKWESCRECRWFVYDGDPDFSSYGHCYRHPPTVGVIASQPVTMRPKVRDHDTCGDWATKETV